MRGEIRPRNVGCGRSLAFGCDVAEFWPQKASQAHLETDATEHNTKEATRVPTRGKESAVKARNAEAATECPEKGRKPEKRPRKAPRGRAENPREKGKERRERVSPREKEKVPPTTPSKRKSSPLGERGEETQEGLTVHTLPAPSDSELDAMERGLTVGERYLIDVLVTDHPYVDGGGWFDPYRKIASDAHGAKMATVEQRENPIKVFGPFIDSLCDKNVFERESTPQGADAGAEGGTTQGRVRVTKTGEVLFRRMYDHWKFKRSFVTSELRAAMRNG